MLKHYLFWLILAFTLCACKQGISDMEESFTISNETQKDLAVVSQARIFFGHQSVGNNIIAGIEDIQRHADEQAIRVIELGDEAEYPESFLLHSKIGKNTDPESKCEDFKRIIDHQLVGIIDYALLKFCYIDIDERSDLEAIFERYRHTLDTLKARHPDITFIHVTAPLRHSQSGFGVWIREILGRPNHSKLDNIKRNIFNEMLLSTYSDGPIFDLAASQSTYPDGRRETFKYKGNTYYGLIGNYTNDGGHLNEKGRRHVATDLLNSLATSITVHPASNRQ